MDVGILYIHIYVYNWFSLFMVVMSYSHCKCWISKYWTIATRRYRELSSCKPLITFLQPSIHNMVFYLIYVVDILTLNSWPTALYFMPKQILSNTHTSSIRTQCGIDLFLSISRSLPPPNSSLLLIFRRRKEMI